MKTNSVHKTLILLGVLTIMFLLFDIQKTYAKAYINWQVKANGVVFNVPTGKTADIPAPESRLEYQPLGWWYTDDGYLEIKGYLYSNSTSYFYDFNKLQFHVFDADTNNLIFSSFLGKEDIKTQFGELSFTPGEGRLIYLRKRDENANAGKKTPYNNIVVELDSICYSKEQFEYTSKTPVQVIVNGERVTFDTKPIIEGERVLIPARAVFERLGAIVTWDQEKREAEITLKIDGVDKSLNLTIDSNIALVDGKEIALDVPARIINDRTVIPLRFVAENFNMKVLWLKRINTAEIFQR